MSRGRWEPGLHTARLPGPQDLGSIRTSPPRSCQWSPPELARPHRRSQTWCGRREMDKCGAAVSRLGCSCAGRAGKRFLEMRDLSHMPPSRPAAPTCYRDEGSTDLGLALGWVLPAQGPTHHSEGNIMSSCSIPHASPSLFHEPFLHLFSLPSTPNPSSSSSVNTSYPDHQNPGVHPCFAFLDSEVKVGATQLNICIM